ncbi:AraC family transcriptional regulator [Ectopseudomonas composti]|uniref:AraC family transcriptional regulator n=1 Tax=Ectopseudomonas composti TaxID=658457 RepID=UPI000772F6E0|nr:AraC family transcriptional regulator [Pseudomonas composti]
MTMDRLSSLLHHFNLHASTFHRGGFCGTSSHGEHEPHGYIHLLRAGRMSFREGDGRELRLEEPSLMLVARPRLHQMSASEADGAELVCATLVFDGGIDNPLSRSLPGAIVKPLRELPSLSGCLDWLFAEAAGEDCGRELVLNRLFELMVIQLLRHLMSSRELASGMMAGLAEPRLARALNQLHEKPQHGWSVAELAALAGMSRASFAAHFHQVVGATPADYLVGWRVSLAQKRLREGRPMALIADEVGYESPSALARAFRRKVGASPSEWLRQVAQ